MKFAFPSRVSPMFPATLKSSLRTNEIRHWAWDVRSHANDICIVISRQSYASQLKLYRLSVETWKLQLKKRCTRRNVTMKNVAIYYG